MNDHPTPLILALALFLAVQSCRVWWRGLARDGAWEKWHLEVKEHARTKGELERVRAERDEILAENDAMWESWCERNGVDLAAHHWPEILDR